MTASRYTAFSSETYPLEAADLLPLIKNGPYKKPKQNSVVLSIGRKDQYNDCAWGDLKMIQTAAEKGGTVPVRVAFRGYSPFFVRWLWHAIHPLRKQTTRLATGVYHINPQELRNRGLELLVRHEQNAYRDISRTLLPFGEELAHWNRLKTSIMENGFKDSFPIVILLRRTHGVRDRLLQGHHRLAISLELGLTRVPVTFAYAGHAPWFVSGIYDACRRKKA
jgi:hypothetical protein